MPEEFAVVGRRESVQQGLLAGDALRDADHSACGGVRRASSRQTGKRTAALVHVGVNVAWADGDRDEAFRGDLLGELGVEHVQRRFRDGVRGVGEWASLFEQPGVRGNERANVEDNLLRAGAEERERSESQADGADHVDVEHRDIVLQRTGRSSDAFRGNPGEEHLRLEDGVRRVNRAGVVDQIIELATSKLLRLCDDVLWGPSRLLARVAMQQKHVRLRFLCS